MPFGFGELAVIGVVGAAMVLGTSGAGTAYPVHP